MIPLIFYKNAVLVHSHKRFSNIHTKNMYINQKKAQKKVDNNNVLCNNHYKKQRYTH